MEIIRVAFFRDYHFKPFPPPPLPPLSLRLSLFLRPLSLSLFVRLFLSNPSFFYLSTSRYLRPFVCTLRRKRKREVLDRRRIARKIRIYICIERERGGKRGERERGGPAGRIIKRNGWRRLRRSIRPLFSSFFVIFRRGTANCTFRARARARAYYAAKCSSFSSFERAAAVPPARVRAITIAPRMRSRASAGARNNARDKARENCGARI